MSGILTLEGLRVLVVDDDGDARELLREVLQQRRAHVTTASSAREALEALGADRPHVLVSDVAMRGEDGYDLIRRVRGGPHDGGRIPALALTAHARDEDHLGALSAASGCTPPSPSSLSELVAAVATLAGPSLPRGRDGLRPAGARLQDLQDQDPRRHRPDPVAVLVEAADPARSTSSAG